MSGGSYINAYVFFLSLAPYFRWAAIRNWRSNPLCYCGISMSGCRVCSTYKCHISKRIPSQLMKKKKKKKKRAITLWHPVCGTMSWRTRTSLVRNKHRSGPPPSFSKTRAGSRRGCQKGLEKPTRPPGSQEPALQDIFWNLLDLNFQGTLVDAFFRHLGGLISQLIEIGWELHHATATTTASTLLGSGVCVSPPSSR